MNFYLQKEDTNFQHDFIYSLSSIIEIENMGRKEPKYNIIYSNYETVYNNELNKNGIYVGSIEFMLMVFKKLNIVTKPINIPDSIKEYCLRDIWYGLKSDIKIPCFLKPAEEIKLFTGFLLEKDLDLKLYFPEILDTTKLMFSEPIDIISEWRAFVYKGELVGLTNYNYDFRIFPNVNLIEECIGEYKDAPISYTIDFAVTKDNKTVLIEVNDFFSCGTYGFSDYCLPNMFIDRFRQITQMGY